MKNFGEEHELTMRAFRIMISIYRHLDDDDKVVAYHRTSVIKEKDSLRKKT